MMGGRRRALVALAAVAVVAAVTVAAAALAALGRLDTAPDASGAARQRAEQLAVDLDDDLDTTLRSLPPWAVARLDTGEPAALPVHGTVAVTTGPTCVGVEVTVDVRWVTDGDQDAVDVGPVRALPEVACGR